MVHIQRNNRCAYHCTAEQPDREKRFLRPTICTICLHLTDLNGTQKRYHSSFSSPTLTRCRHYLFIGYRRRIQAYQPTSFSKTFIMLAVGLIMSCFKVCWWDWDLLTSLLPLWLIIGKFQFSLCPGIVCQFDIYLLTYNNYLWTCCRVCSPKLQVVLG